MVVCQPPLRYLSQQKGWSGRKGSTTGRVAYISLVGSLWFIFEFILDFLKDNLVILVIKSLIPYQRPILHDFWKDNLMVLVIKFIFPYQRSTLSY